MAKKFFGLGILVTVLVFAMVVVGCDDSSGTDINSISYAAVSQWGGQDVDDGSSNSGVIAIIFYPTVADGSNTNSAKVTVADLDWIAVENISFDIFGTDSSGRTLVANSVGEAYIRDNFYEGGVAVDVDVTRGGTISLSDLAYATVKLDFPNSFTSKYKEVREYGSITVRF